MPININNLNSTLQEMKDVFLADPNTAVRGQNFIKKLHDFCKQELEDRLNGLNLKVLLEAKVLTTHKKKDVDVAIVHPTSGPLLIIGVRSQMSSLSKNFLNYYEMEVGDVSGTHERFPLCVVGLLYLHPKEVILPNASPETFNFDRAEKMFKLISDRKRQTDPYGWYEDIAYLRVNFHEDPPTHDTSFPSDPTLRIDDFFDSLWAKFKERNFFLET